MVTTARTSVNNAGIVSLIQVGQGARWSHDQAKKVETVARGLAPKRTGRLVSQHVTLPTTGTNQYQKVWRVSSMAPYSRYPYFGTGIYGPRATPIVSRRGFKLPGPNPRHPNWKRAQPRLSLTSKGRLTTVIAVQSTVVHVIRGQHGHRWLEEAARIALHV